MFHVLPAGARLYRATDIGRTWQDVVSGVGSYFTTGGRFNRVQQRTVYASTQALVSIAESAAHIAVDRWQPRIGRGFLGVLPALTAPVPPLVSEHWLWEFTVDTDMQLIDVESPAALATFTIDSTKYSTRRRPIEPRPTWQMRFGCTPIPTPLTPLSMGSWPRQ
jgi:RES domain